MRTYLINFIFSILTFLFISCGFGTSNSSCPQNTNNQHPVQTSEEDEWVEVEEEVTCTNCNGSGTRTGTCSSCSGRGSVPRFSVGTRPKTCETCCGTGIVRCYKCDGNGFIKCPSCDDGRNTCLTCNGRGTLFVSDDYIICPACSGSGREDCPMCDGGYIKCNCDRGLRSCMDCRGTGYNGTESYSETKFINCDRCKGTGFCSTTCYKCDGSGKIIETKIVKKTKI